MSAEMPQATEAEQHEEGEALDVSVLPPTDQGLAAWMFLFRCFIVEGLLWGFLTAYGIFQKYYSFQPELIESPNIAAVGTVSTSIYFLGAPLATPIVLRFRRWRRHMMLVGTATCIISLVAASFAPSVTVLIITQGALYGFGFLVVYFPLISLLNEWFVQRRAFAYAVVYAGGGISGIGLPFLVEWLLLRYGFRSTLRIVAVIQFVLLAPVLPFLRGRLPASNQTIPRDIDLRFPKTPLFWVWVASNLSQSFAYYIPSLYLPTFASRIGLSGTTGALVLAVHNLATVIGQLCFGHLSDRLKNISILVIITGVGASAATFGLWGFAQSLAPLLAFSVVYGFFAGAYVVFWPLFGSMLSDDPQPVFSLMAFGKGIGNILTAPIAEALLKMRLQPSYGARDFRALIIYLGSLMLLSSLGGIPWLINTRWQ